MSIKGLMPECHFRKIFYSAAATAIMEPTSKNSVIHVKGNLTLVPPEAIAVHQTNCTTTYAEALSKQIAEKQGPEHCVYAQRLKKPEKKIYNLPGDIVMTRGNMTVCNLMGQIYPREAEKEGDLPEDRLKYFNTGLENLAKHLISNEDASDLYFPRGIGCGCAGGDWDQYLSSIEAFAQTVPNKVYIVAFDRNVTTFPFSQ